MGEFTFQLTYFVAKSLIVLKLYDVLHELKCCWSFEPDFFILKHFFLQRHELFFVLISATSFESKENICGRS